MTQSLTFKDLNVISTEGEVIIKLIADEPEDYLIRIINTEGQSVYTDQIRATKGCYTKSLRPMLTNGLYFVEVSSKQKRTFKKIVIKE